MLKRLNIPSVKLNINSLGNRETRKHYNALLMEFLENHKEDLCETCQERMYKNPYVFWTVKMNLARPS